MSQRMVESVIDELVMDEDLRVRFLVDRMETVAELFLRGFELSGDEIDLFCGMDARMWLWDGAGELQH